MANKFLFLLCFCMSLQSSLFADIPSAKSENSLSIGTGVTSFLNGFINIFHPINKHLGIGIGAGSHYQIIEYYYHYFGLVRIYNSDQSAVCLFYELGHLSARWHTSIDSSAIGLGFSRLYKDNKIDGAISLTTKTPSHFGLGTGVKITKPSGTFYGLSLLDKLPNFTIGKTYLFSNGLSEKTQ